MPVVRPKTPVQGDKPMANSLLHTQITIALQMVRQARFDGSYEAIEVAERHLNRLIEKLEKVPAPA